MTTLQDLRFAFRVLRRSPGYTAVVLLTLAVAIGANTAIFSLVDAVLIKMLPVKNPEELVAIDLYNQRGERNSFSYPFFEQLRDRTKTFAGVFAATDGTITMDIAGPAPAAQPVQAEVQLVSGEYFPVLGVNAIAGRTLTTEDNKAPGAHPVAVISYGFWRNQLGADASAIGRGITVKNQPFTIIGVTPPEFFGESVGRAPDIWVPLMMQPQFDRGESFLAQANRGWLRVMARLESGASKEQTQASLALWLSQLQSDAGDLGRNARRVRNVEVMNASRGLSETRKKFSKQLWIMMAVVVLVLLIACANIANLLLVRSTARAKEVAIRLAIGAGRWRLVRQFLTESLVLAVAGGLIGLIFASWGSRVLLVLASEGKTPIPIDVSVNSRILSFTMLVSLITAILFGLMPALTASRQDVNTTLKISAAAASPRLSLSRFLVIVQVALSLLLLTGAGLFVQTLQNLRSRNLGFAADKVLQVSLDPLSGGYKEDQLPDLYRRLLEGIKSAPGIASASMANSGFRTGDTRTCCIAVEGYQPSSSEDREIRTDRVTPGYFETMGLPILLGRDFLPQESNPHKKSGDQPPKKVAIINEVMARHYFRTGNPIGKRFGWGDPPDVKYDIEIIGVAQNAIYGNLREQTSPVIYFPTQGGTLLLVRATNAPEAVASSIVREIKAIDQNVEIFGVNTVPQLIDQALMLEKLLAKISGFFGSLALLLAAIGLYGVMSYAVARRTKEIAIRMALGAQPMNVRWMVMRETLVLVVIGVLIGVPSALATSRFISSLLFGLSPTSAITLLLATLLMIAISSLAAYLPARRASQVDPMVALKYE
ncbi:MAG TPA: ABC transporter permease [Pyrinomonadaceae bacterium]|nr:ABC transporter permease [Pyrinomonadaceae bacterium]